MFTAAVFRFGDSYLETFARNGLLDVVDVLSFHSYEEPFYQEQLVGYFRLWLEKHGHGDKQLACTESGIQSACKNAKEPPWLSAVQWCCCADRPPDEGPRPRSRQQEALGALKQTFKQTENFALGVQSHAFILPFYQEEGVGFGMLGAEGTPLRTLAGYAQAIRALSHSRYVADMVDDSRFEEDLDDGKVERMLNNFASHRCVRVSANSPERLTWCGLSGERRAYRSEQNLRAQARHAAGCARRCIRGGTISSWPTLGPNAGQQRKQAAREGRRPGQLCPDPQRAPAARGGRNRRPLPAHSHWRQLSVCPRNTSPILPFPSHHHLPVGRYVDVQDGLVYLWLGPCALSTFAVPFTFATQLNRIAGLEEGPASPSAAPPMAPSPIVLQHLRNNSQAAIANQDDGCDIDNTRHHPEQPKVFCMRSAYYLTSGNASALSLTIRVHNLGLEPRSVELSARIGEDPAQIRPVAPVATAVSVAGRAHLDVQFRLDLTAAFAASDDRAAPATTVTVSGGSGRSAGAAMCAVDFALWQQADG